MKPMRSVCSSVEAHIGATELNMNVAKLRKRKKDNTLSCGKMLWYLFEEFWGIETKKEHKHCDRLPFTIYNQKSHLIFECRFWMRLMLSFNSNKMAFPLFLLLLLSCPLKLSKRNNAFNLTELNSILKLYILTSYQTMKSNAIEMWDVYAVCLTIFCATKKEEKKMKTEIIKLLNKSSTKMLITI